MKVAIVTFERFNEIDSFLALSILNRLSERGVCAEICAPTEFVTSMNGVRVQAQRPLEFTREADAVLFGSGRGTLDAISDASIMDRIQVDPETQLIGSQCSGALVLAKLDLLGNMPACTDDMTRPLLEREGVEVHERSFLSQGRVATAGGCLAAQHLAAWVIRCGFDDDALMEAVGSVAPVGEFDACVERIVRALDGSAVGLEFKSADYRA